MPNTTSAHERFVSIDVIATHLKVDPAWIHAACKHCGMPHRVIRGELQFRELEVFEWLWKNNFVDPLDHHEGDL